MKTQLLGSDDRAAGSLLKRRHIRPVCYRSESYKQRVADMLVRYGCTEEQHAHLLELGREMMQRGASSDQTPTRAWQAQRQKARVRKIPWELSLWDWWLVWEKSGKWGMRGRGTGYMMCRFGDTGPYSLDNIYIATGSHNAAFRKYLRNEARNIG